MTFPKARRPDLIKDITEEEDYITKIIVSHVLKYFLLKL